MSRIYRRPELTARVLDECLRSMAADIDQA